jgi:hypothetical protein
MDKESIKKFVLELIEELHEANEVIIWDRSGDISRDEKKNEEQTKKYKEKLEELLK